MMVAPLWRGEVTDARPRPASLTSSPASIICIDESSSSLTLPLPLPLLPSPSASSTDFPFAAAVDRSEPASAAAAAAAAAVAVDLRGLLDDATATAGALSASSAAFSAMVCAAVFFQGPNSFPWQLNLSTFEVSSWNNLSGFRGKLA